jgi:hypothetical protein
MNDSEEVQNLIGIAKSLRKELDIAESTLISFNDELKKLLFKEFSKPDANLERIAQAINFLGEAQADYAKFKTGIGFLFTFIIP